MQGRSNSLRLGDTLHLLTHNAFFSFSFVQDKRSLANQRERLQIKVPVPDSVSKNEKAAFAAYEKLLDEVRDKGTKIMQGLEILLEEVRGCGRCDISFHYFSP